MFKTYLIFFLLGHIISTFYITPPKSGREKVRNPFLSALFHFLTLILLSFSIFSPEILYTSIAISFIYLFAFLIFKEHTGSPKTFLTSQLLLLLVITIASYILACNKADNIPIYHFASFTSITGINFITIMTWATALLLIDRPASYLITNLLASYKPTLIPESEEKKEEDKNAGRFIGVLERIIIIILLSAGQYSALGLVLTAKSIARYDKITKNSAFAEYYLLGTLLSALIALAASCILR